jgi:hypothetical protein
MSIVGSYTIPNVGSNPVCRMSASFMNWLHAKRIEHALTLHRPRGPACMHGCALFFLYPLYRIRRVLLLRSSSTSRTTTWQSFLMEYVRASAVCVCVCVCVLEFVVRVICVTRPHGQSLVSSLQLFVRQKGVGLQRECVTSLMPHHPTCQKEEEACSNWIRCLSEFLPC